MSSKSNIIYQPVIKEFYALHSPKSDFSTPYFIYLSSFTGRKNHAILVEAFAKIQKTCDWNLLLVGAAGPTEQTVRNFIHNEKLDNRITILTNLDQKDLVGIMQGASGFLYPSFFEGFGIPLAEAAVCNLPM
ncbi:MAG: glycosyltransferase, partial [Bacteroidia bacterium]|nr:glycosyltransferase [Bacteroidia bacterium]